MVNRTKRLVCLVLSLALAGISGYRYAYLVGGTVMGVDYCCGLCLRKVSAETLRWEAEVSQAIHPYALLVGGLAAIAIGYLVDRLIRQQRQGLAVLVLVITGFASLVSQGCWLFGPPFGR